MAFPAVTETLPLVDLGDGAIRVGRTRVTLDNVITSFVNGSTPEHIVEQFPTLNLADVYQVIGYYLRHPDVVEQYLQEREREADELRQFHESRFDPNGVRDRLLARLADQSS